jgi:putative ABC transport system permease protein
MTLIGILIGIPLAQQMVVSISNTMSSDLFRLDTYLPTWVHLVTGGLTILFVLIAQASSYWKINRLDFIEALKNRMS